MILQDYVKKLLRDYFIILGVLVFGVIILSSELGYAITINNLYSLLISALVMELARSITYSHYLTKGKTMYTGIGIQLIVVEAGLLFPAYLLGLTPVYIQMMPLAFEIAVMYLAIRLLIWKANKKSAEEINKKLESMRRCKGSMFGLNH